MRLRRASPFLLLLSTASLVHSDSKDSDTKLRDQDLLRKIDAQVEALDVRRETEPPVLPATTTTKASQYTSKPYKGTEDAPVDGLDGKPHAGPFVDTTPEESDLRQKDGSRPASLDRFATSGDERWKLEDIPERNDGVMNDEYRVAPKKGTTGTEGGISEKTRLREEDGGKYAETRPHEPKEAPPLPHSEQELIKGDAYAKADTTSASAALQSAVPPPPRRLRRDGEPEEGWTKETVPFTSYGRYNEEPPRTLYEFIFGRKTPKPPAAASDEPISPDEAHDADESWHEWVHSFVLSFTMILFSEIGDKTFLVAALMAMRHNQILVFSAALGALIVMTVLSAVLGHAVPTLLPKRLTTFAAAILFLVFGAKMMKEGLEMPKEAGVGEEMKEVEAELEEKEHSMAMDRSRRRSSLSPYTLESGRGRRESRALSNKFAERPPGELSPPASRSPTPSPSPPRGLKGRLSGLTNLLSLVLSPAWVQTFVMTFLGEWGDRSQIATIAMAAGQDYWWVTLGACAGHACCTGLAVIGGRALAGRVSMRVVTIGGAGAFLVFGVIYIIECIFE